ncbi:MAG TPA: Na+/H+ antiporter [Solirubrobacteraceae bacterium]|nr:Na+/H+ antiporter [Solirubrobacteraceae bacterium]
MHDIEVLLALLAVAAGAVWLARALGIPYPILLVLAGVGVGYLPGVSEIEIAPDVIFLVFLPPLLHAAGWLSSPRHLRTYATGVSLLAGVLVLLTTGAVAVVAHAVVPGLPWGPAFVLGAIVSATDTVAAAAVFRRLGVPERVGAIVEGESLVNDGTALVVYRTAVAAVAAASFSLGDAVHDLMLVGTGGAALGLAIAWVVRHLRRRIDDDLIEITVTLLTAYLAFIGAEELGLSGVLAAVTSGLYLGVKQSQDFSAGTRLKAYSFWEVLVFLLESLLFILIGLQFPGVLESLEARSAGELMWWAAAVSGTVIGVRLLFVMTVPGLGPFSRRERAVVGWSGMRGAIALAAALAMPLDLPQREALLFLTLAVIAVTLGLQGLTLPILIRRLGVEDAAGTDVRIKALTRFRTVEAALATIADLAFSGSEVPTALLDRAREMYGERSRQLAGECRIPEEGGSDLDPVGWLELRRRLLDAEREALLDLLDEGAVPLAAIREVERDLDLEEERLNRTPVAAA